MTEMPNRRILFNADSLGPYWGHVLALLGPCISHFYNIFAPRWLNWFKFSLKSHVWQLKEYLDMSMLCSAGLTMLEPQLGHIGAIFGNFTIDLLLDAWNGSNFHWSVIFALRCLNWLIFFAKKACISNRSAQVMYNYWEDIWATFCPY